jgi:hypothetical protein
VHKQNNHGIKALNEVTKIIDGTTEYVACLMEAMEILNTTIQNMENKLNNFQKEQKYSYDSFQSGQNFRKVNSRTLTKESHLYVSIVSNQNTRLPTVQKETLLSDPTEILKVEAMILEITPQQHIGKFILIEAESIIT